MRTTGLARNATYSRYTSDVTRDALDSTDLTLLELIQQDARRTHAELGREVHLSAPAVAQRLKRLERQEVVRGYRAIVELEAVGLGVTVFVQITLSLHGAEPIESFRDFVRQVLEVLECHNVSGDFDYLLKVVAQDIAAYEALVRSTLSRAPGVARIQSLFVLKTSKDGGPASLASARVTSPHDWRP